MVLSTTTTYPHRWKSDGTYDSICFNCFRTIANAASEEDLVPAEAEHCCDPEDLVGRFSPA